MGEIILKDLGEHACEKWLQNKEGMLTGRITSYALSGTIMLTKEEYEKEEQLRDNQNR